ncbi:hypothetical protein DERP_000682 [Dermatophagoides pteronyssinus]|uniref:Uncharacterized protein n=1 Tax=Dermatophagoides pteronyssinus TaxID=6956 RepID=A0ABQ8J0V8_DERPT|nr:hypothetical protein DERP_000682 [Dermatophagoides pteronyssinus]
MESLIFTMSTRKQHRESRKHETGISFLRVHFQNLKVFKQPKQHEKWKTLRLLSLSAETLTELLKSNQLVEFDLVD